MDRNELFKYLSDYGDTVNSGTAKTANYVDIKNKIRQAYDAGSIDKDSMKQLSDKASGVFKNMGRSPELENLSNKIVQKGGTVLGAEGMTTRFPTSKRILEGVEDSTSSIIDQIRNNRNISSATPGMPALSGKTAVLETVGDIADSIPNPTTTSLERLNTPKSTGRFGKTLKALGILGPAIGAMSMSDKVMAGDFGGAGMEGVDLATDYIPGIGQVKDAIRPEEIGNSELPPEEMAARAVYNEQARRGKGMAPPAEIENLEEPARYSDMNEQIRNRFNVLNRMK